MKLTFFNDTGRDLRIHGASAKPASGVAVVKPGVSVVFELPDHAEPFVKVWPDAMAVLVPGWPSRD
jgi:hypothetical protein